MSYLTKYMLRNTLLNKINFILRNNKQKSKDQFDPLAQSASNSKILKPEGFSKGTGIFKAAPINSEKYEAQRKQTFLNKSSYLDFKNTSKIVSKQPLDLLYNYRVYLQNLINFTHINDQRCNTFRNKILFYKIVLNSHLELKKSNHSEKQNELFFYLLTMIIKNSKNLPYSLILIYTNLYIRFYLVFIGPTPSLMSKKSSLEFWRLTKKHHNKNSRSWILRKYWLKSEFFYKLNNPQRLYSSQLRSEKLTQSFSRSKKTYFYKNLLYNKFLNRLPFGNNRNHYYRNSLNKKKVIYTGNSIKTINLTKTVTNIKWSKNNMMLYSCFNSI